MDWKSTFSFKDVEWNQNGDYTFTEGRFDLLGLMELKGSYTFGYLTDQVSTISTNAMLFIDNGFTFSYGPIDSTNRQLIEMKDATSAIYLNGMTLKSSTTGMQLTKGTLFIDHKNFLDNFDYRNRAGRSVSEAIAFGDGTAANDLSIEVMPGGNLEILLGRLAYWNVN